MKMLYKPGNMYKIREGSVDYKVFEVDEVDEAIDLGWFEDPIDCLLKKLKSNPSPEGNNPNSREAMEDKAKSLGVSFNSRTSDEVLNSRIAEASEEE